MTQPLDRLAQALGDRYTIERELGAGGMATVYLAHDVRHNRKVAVKVLRPELAAALGPERFLREITTTAQLNHPHILALHDSGEAEGFLFYVTPYVEGESLRDRLKREKQLPIDDALAIVREVADALTYAHSHDVIHRDVKPENILMSGGHAVVADFGIARAISEAGGEKLTETGLAVGTPAYMSPEQAAGEKGLDGRSDTYSLGCVLFEMLAGDPPFTGRNPQAILARKVLETAPSIRTVRDTVSDELEQAITRCLAKVPADRFASANQLVEAISGAPSAAWAKGGGSARQRYGKWVGIASASVVVAVGAWVVLGRSAPADEIHSLAVLPWVNLTGDASRDPFVEGMHGAVIDQLAGIRALDVRARRTMAAYRGTDKPPAQIARELGVQALLAGEVFSVGDSIRVQLELLDPARGSLLWSSVYDREAGNVLSLYREIASSVAEEIRIAVTPAERRGFGDARRVDPEVYRNYQLGLHASRSVAEANFELALDYFQRAVRLDSTFAAVWAELASTYSFLASLGVRPVKDMRPLAMDAANRAVLLDDELADSHRALGGLWIMNWEHERAERAYRRALELRPNDAEANFQYGNLLMALGRGEEGSQYVARGLELDPGNLWRKTLLAWQLHFSGRRDQAIRYARESTRANPDFHWTWWVLALLHLERGEYAQALTALDRQIPLMRGYISDEVTAKGVAFALSGQRDSAQQMLVRLDELERQGLVVRPVFRSLVLSKLGESDEAFNLLTQAVEERDSYFVLLSRFSVLWSSFESDPRFHELIQSSDLAPFFN